LIALYSKIMGKGGCLNEEIFFNMPLAPMIEQMRWLVVNIQPRRYVLLEGLWFAYLLKKFPERWSLLGSICQIFIFGIALSIKKS
jgi:hypothetical protein